MSCIASTPSVRGGDYGPVEQRRLAIADVTAVALGEVCVSWIDCSTFDSAAGSVSAAIRRSETSLIEALLAYLPSFDPIPQEDPFLQLPREILASIDTSVDDVLSALVGAYYFQGTRLEDPEAVRINGLLPLSDFIDAIWDLLGRLIEDEPAERTWDQRRSEFEAGGAGHSHLLYELKREAAVHHGPFGVLVRECLLKPRECGIRDFLQGAEIVEDIANGLSGRYPDLYRRYQSVTTPCIIHFRSTRVGADEVRSAFWYLHSVVMGVEFPHANRGGFSGNGKAVPPVDIVAVEVM